MVRRVACRSCVCWRSAGRLKAEVKRAQARINVLMAREAHLAVVNRRGPARQTATMLRARTTDEFRIGQWKEGRVISWDDHVLVHQSRQIEIECKDWESADRGRDRLVWSAGGSYLLATLLKRAETMKGSCMTSTSCAVKHPQRPMTSSLKVHLIQ